MLARPSGNGEPVASCSSSALIASRAPSTSTVSSSSTAVRVVSGVWRRNVRTGTPRLRVRLRSSRTETLRLQPSSTSATVSTARPIQRSSMPRPCRSAETPARSRARRRRRRCRRPPAAPRSSAPCRGRAGARRRRGGRRAAARSRAAPGCRRRPAECSVSATSAAEPVSAAATPFAIAIATLAISAEATARRLPAAEVLGAGALMARVCPESAQPASTQNTDGAPRCLGAPSVEVRSSRRYVTSAIVPPGPSARRAHLPVAVGCASSPSAHAGRGDQRRSVRTLCGSWLAWLSMAVPAWLMICSLVRLTISLAMSVSRTRLSEACRFSW